MKRELTSARAVIAGDASGEVLYGTTALSFWGGVDAHSGCVTDRRHNLYGRPFTGKVLVLPGAAGSCSTSGILLEMIRVGMMPAAVICVYAEPLLCMGSVISEKLYGKWMPVYTVSEEEYALLANAGQVEIRADRIVITEGEGEV